MILIVAILVIPADDWPRVLRAVLKFVRGIRRIIWQIEDKIDEIENQVMKDLPVDELRKMDVTKEFAIPAPKKRGRK